MMPCLGTIRETLVWESGQGALATLTNDLRFLKSESVIKTSGWGLE